MASVENSSYAEFAQRIVRAFAARVADGDIDALADLVELRDLLDQGIGDAVRALRSEPHLYSAQQIADRLGVTRQAVMKRWPVEDKSRIRRPGGQTTELR
jgi:hypothetical protein